MNHGEAIVCGDGICSSPSETNGTCPGDCTSDNMVGNNFGGAGDLQFCGNGVKDTATELDPG